MVNEFIPPVRLLPEEKSKPLSTRENRDSGVVRLEAEEGGRDGGPKSRQEE